MCVCHLSLRGRFSLLARLAGLRIHLILGLRHAQSSWTVLHGFWGFELGSSCLHSTALTH